MARKKSESDKTKTIKNIVKTRRTKSGGKRPKKNKLDERFRKVAKSVLSRKPPKINWKGSNYGSIIELSIDQRGQVGEELTVNILREKGCEIVYNPNKTDREKDWDMISNGIKIEIKLATLGKEGRSFQHEGLERSRRFDALMILDVAPDALYLSCYDYEELDWKAMHRRPNGVYKFDLSLAKVQNHRVDTVEEFFSSYKAMEKKANFRLKKKKKEEQL